MYFTTRTTSSALAAGAACVAIVSGQSMLMAVMIRHGVQVPGGSYERAFDAGVRPTTPVNPGTFATPLGMMTSATGGDRIDAAFAFGILAGHAGRAASPQELAAAGQALAQMIAADDRRTRIAGARVAGRIFAVPFETGPRAVTTPGLADALFSLLNRSNEIEQLAAMDALGLMRQVSAVASLTERYRFYRANNQRALAGGALEALARIGDPSSHAIARAVVTDKWSEGRDSTALAVAFARERLLRDGSIAMIRQAIDDRSRRAQALGYLAELGVAAP
jgi:hypothetical protein